MVGPSVGSAFGLSVPLSRCRKSGQKAMSDLHYCPWQVQWPPICDCIRLCSLTWSADFFWSLKCELLSFTRAKCILPVLWENMSPLSAFIPCFQAPLIEKRFSSLKKSVFLPVGGVPSLRLVQQGGTQLARQDSTERDRRKDRLKTELEQTFENRWKNE